MKYKDLEFKIPQESPDYSECSDFVVTNIETIIQEAIENGLNKIIINTNLKYGLPMENINKIAGPFVEAWAFEIFYNIKEKTKNKYKLINVESKERLYMSDIVLQFKKERENESSVTANVDVKATSEDIETAGKSPNITSFARIRTEYIKDPDYIFVILSLKHKVYSEKDTKTNLMNGIMEIVKFNAYDLKYISESDFNFNPALGSGQLQIKDIHYVTIEKRTTWEFCRLLDKKYLKSTKKKFKDWYALAKTNEWIKFEE
jgi:hypothetical protein